MPAKAMIVEALKTGTFGPQGAIYVAARLFALQYELLQELRAANAGRRYRRRPVKLRKVWPELERWKDETEAAISGKINPSKVAAQLEAFRASAARLGSG